MENRRAGATVSWDRQVPAKVATAPEARIDLFHGDAYFIGRVASCADPLVTSAGERWGVAHEVPSTLGKRERRLSGRREARGGTAVRFRGTV